VLPTSDIYKQTIALGTRSSESIIYFGLYDVTAKDDAHPSATDIQPFTDVQNIKDNIRRPSINIATLEENYFKLDGSFVTTPNDLSPAYLLGWWSLSQSDANRVFEHNPVIQITFLNLHSSLGGEIFFDDVGGSYCESFKLTWLYNSTVIMEKLVEGNTKPRHYVDIPVANYNRMLIELIRTDKPFRYARVTEVNFGGEEIFNGDNLVKAEILEEVDPSCSTLSINTLKFTVLNENQRFNMINPEGVYSLLQRRQQIVAQTGIKLPNGNTEWIPLGGYYLSHWENSTGLTATLEATDAFGLMDKTTFNTSPMWINEPVENVLSYILADAGTFPHTLGQGFEGETITGYIPIMSHREAIQCVLMSIRACIRDNRNGTFEIFRPDYANISKVIDYTTIIGTPKISQLPLITSVAVTDYTYEPGIETEELYNSTFDVDGTIELVIPYKASPATNVTATLTGNGSIIGTPLYYAAAAKLTIQGTGSITLIVSGNVYQTPSTIKTVSLVDLPAGELPQLAEVKDNFLISGKGYVVAQYLLNYYSRRINQDFQYWDDPSLQAGDAVSVQTMFGMQKYGVIERRELQFAPSLKSRMEVIG
jgi:hypothetical protein